MRKTTAIWLGLLMALGTMAMAADDGAPRGDGEFGDHPGMERFHADRMERLQAFLDLTDQQVEEWRALHDGRFEGMRSQHDDMRAIHERIRELTEADNPDAAAVGELVIEARRMKAAAEAEREAVHAQVLEILTPEQQERFEAMQELHGDRRGQGRRGPGRHLRHHGGSERD